MPEAGADTPPNTYAVVYQMGKVASTSLVATFNKVDGIEAVQCHFMGKDALAKILQNILEPGTSDYFFFHQRGQLIQNIDITRRVSTLRGDTDSATRLFVLSLARDPMAWFRSALTQDAGAHVDDMKQFLVQTNQDVPTDPDAIIRTALPQMLDGIVAAVEKTEGLEDLTRLNAASAAALVPNLVPACVNIAFLMLRPFNWFQSHFVQALGVRLHEMTPVNGYWIHEGPNEVIATIRYEDLTTRLPVLTSSIGMGAIDLAVSDNVSKGKDYSEAIIEVLETHDLGLLQEIFDRSSYSRFFGYSR